MKQYIFLIFISLCTNFYIYASAQKETIPQVITPSTQIVVPNIESNLEEEIIMHEKDREDPRTQKKSQEKNNRYVIEARKDFDMSLLEKIEGIEIINSTEISLLYISIKITNVSVLSEIQALEGIYTVNKDVYRNIYKN